MTSRLTDAELLALALSRPHEANSPQTTIRKIGIQHAGSKDLSFGLTMTLKKRHGGWWIISMWICRLRCGAEDFGSSR
jgi:hypothetical protein